MEQTLAQEVAIITGTDSGIGQATAIAFAKEGADVAVTYLHDTEGAEHTQREVEAAGRKAALIQLDQRDPHSVENLFREVQKNLDTPTILVNNASSDAIGKPVKDMSIEEWDDQFRTNLYGPFFCYQQFLRTIEGTGKHGTIINITSVHQEFHGLGLQVMTSPRGG